MGKIQVVGIGPGDSGNMTKLCEDCLKNADIIVGYTGYISLLRPMLPDATYLETGMTRETERCRAAVDLAREGKTVCVVSSGDSGVYGMASLIFELAQNTVEVEIIPGVTAAVSGAAMLGAPIGCDFAVISLSDLLTPWDIIEKRLRAAAQGDFSICLYNPGSKTRSEHLATACDILMETFPEDRICGIARNIGREGQSYYLTTLGELRMTKTDMSETVFIGNSTTVNIEGRMVTPRGYRV